MEKLKGLPLYRRLWFRVFLFHALLLISVIAPVWIIRNGDYKNLIDRISFQRQLFHHALAVLEDLPPEDWAETLNGFPGILYQQRILLFRYDGSLFYDSGVMRDAESHISYGRYELLLPHPYTESYAAAVSDQASFLRALKAIPGVEERDYSRRQQLTWTISTPRGLDRLVLMARDVAPWEEEGYVLVFSSSVVDILLQYRAIKERFLFLFLIVSALGCLLTFVLSRSVTRPFKQLYSISREILQGRRGAPDTAMPATKGEIGEICRAFHRLISQQQSQSENFRCFSSDVVHELKTPLAAIRSGWELYTESGDPEEKRQIDQRIQRRMLRMEGLLNEIEQLGRLESTVEQGATDQILRVVREIREEYRDSGLLLDIQEGVESPLLPLPAEKLYRVVSNLVNNAISFSPEKGSVRLSVSAEPERVILQVRDRGPGIPQDVLDHITERFYSYRPHRTDTHSGLGLAIVQAVAGGCGGRLSYGNTGEGAVFTVEIPRMEKSPGKIFLDPEITRRR